MRYTDAQNILPPDAVIHHENWAEMYSYGGQRPRKVRSQTISAQVNQRTYPK